MRAATLIRALVISGLGLSIPSCTASLELDRFRSDSAPIEAGPPSDAPFLDVRLTATSMESHLNEYFELRIVDASNNVQAKAIYNDVVGANFVMPLRRIVPKTNGPYRIDFWADHNLSGGYDGIVGGINEKDHAWRRVLSDPLPADIQLVGPTYEFAFLHDTNFVDIFTDLTGNKIPGEPTLLPCEISVTGAGAYLGKMMELRVTQKASGRLVGFYRQGRARETFAANITDILDEVTAYEVSAYVDLNDTATFDEGDPSWKFDFTSNTAGAALELNVTTLAQAPISLE